MCDKAATEGIIKKTFSQTDPQSFRNKTLINSIILFLLSFLYWICGGACPFIALISKDEVIGHLVSVVPRVQFLVQGAVGHLRGVCVHVGECQTRHGVCERVCVKGVGHVSVAMFHTVHCVKHAADQEAVSVATTPQTCAEALYGLQVSVAQVEEQDDLLVEALRVQSRVQQPQAGLIHSKLHLETHMLSLGGPSLNPYMSLYPGGYIHLTGCGNV